MSGVRNIVPLTFPSKSRAVGARALVVVVVVVAAILGEVSCKLPNVLAPQSPVDFCIEQAKAFCDLQFQCCTAVERTGDPLHLFNGPAQSRQPPASADQCVSLLAETCRGAVQQENESVAAGRLTYDVDAASSCLDTLHKAVDACDPGNFFDAEGTYLTSIVQGGEPGILGTDCEDALHAGVSTGDTCFANYECKAGGCVVTDTSTPTEQVHKLKGDCAGEGRTPNPFQANVKFEICNGLTDEGT